MAPIRASLRSMLVSSKPRTTTSPPFLARTLRTTATTRSPYKDDQDRESLKPRKNENTLSGSDDDVAAMDGAFNPSKSSPESQKKGGADRGSSGGESGGKPLEVSPANHEVAEAGRGKTENKSKTKPQKPSGGGSAPKSGKPKQ
ncbi:hypothetical protein BX600DRAFT_511546 [Xylariales sp. PMI_506]|nr:hypothetical protein BX600DRAFT_511546 [Xylariales sp. PMI_506]